MATVTSGGGSVRFVEEAQIRARNYMIARNFDEASLQDHFLVVPVKLVSTTNGFKFKLSKQNNTDAHPLRILLEQQDAFSPSAMALMVSKVPVIDGVEYPANAERISYADPHIFDTATNEQSAINALYSGRVSFNISGHEVFFDIFAEPMKYVPDTQRDPALLQLPATDPVEELAPFYPFSQNVIISGENDNVVSLTVEGANLQDIQGTADGINEAYLIVHGVLSRAGNKRLMEIINGDKALGICSTDVVHYYNEVNVPS